MSYFVILRGPLGVGKSTIAGQLAKAVRAAYVPIDDVLRDHGLDQVAPDAPCIPAENFVRANEVVLPRVRRQLERGQPVVFDACFYHRQPIEHLMAELPYPGFVFTLKAPLEVCVARDHGRAKRHGEDAARAVYGLVSRFDCGVLIDAMKPVQTIVNEIAARLPSDGSGARMRG